MNKQELVDIFQKYSPSTQMDIEETMAYMNMLMSKNPIFDTDINDVDKTDSIYQHFKPLIDSFIVQVFLKRIEVMTTLKISLGGLIILSLHLTSPGTAVMYAYYLYYKLPENTLVTLNIISEKLFPWGFFSDKQLNDIWDAQKVSAKEFGGTDNMIDYEIVWRD